ncbi:hypothetical protein FRX31_030935 [Thalictrum thalictroides]|uniref:Uncharacterized protein n=1 Tax=Thalictrum thalictroides TaxID=46969 RepID=A0A7J6V380_THATH|nr:hypothetical protein FRX31_030935 [Thalictrum thalictroides]
MMLAIRLSVVIFCPEAQTTKKLGLVHPTPVCKGMEQGELGSLCGLWTCIRTGVTTLQQQQNL